ncbi:MAG TPA: hypothetical protein DEQ80_08030 [Anaerolinea thermolimosa]|uniref:Uncharacterized protein n=1 Tax=Anaerolinea thermolimosa TaxID=229919 RepID=A0A3D1JH04_9CHLR|nr:hypothetical protein [Anaerolinea thermolimosa]
MNARGEQHFLVRHQVILDVAHGLNSLRFSFYAPRSIQWKVFTRFPESGQIR